MPAIHAVFLSTAVILGAGARGGPPATTAPARPPDKALEVYARGDHAGAAKLLEGAYKSGGASIQHRLLLGRCYLHLGRADDALAAIKSVLALDAENGEANSLAGRILLQRRQPKQALAYLEHAHRLKKTPATASMLGRCHYALGRATEAKALLQEALEQDIRDPANSFLLGRICLDRGLGALAERYFLAAREAGMDTPELDLLLGKAYLLQRKYVGPVLVRRITRKAEPGEVINGEVVIGQAPGREGMWRVASPYCALYEGLRLLNRSPENADGLYMAARGWAAAGRGDLAEQYERKLADAEPASRRVLELRIERLGGKAALEALLSAPAARQALGAEALSGWYYRHAARLRAAGKRAAALAALGEAEKLTPTSGKVLRALAGLCLATGRREEARGYYLRLVELFPDADDIDELRNTLTVLQEKGQKR
jgi:tetratricopeptide (TPR) repeat protein